MNNKFNHFSAIKQKGFTLIEVLVAAFILFLVIASITMVYRGALLSSGKAERALKFSSMVEPINQQISNQIQESSGQTELQGQGQMGEIIYHWAASQTANSSPPPRFNVDSEKFETGHYIFKLWNVEMQLKYKNTTRQYQFSEVSW